MPERSGNGVVGWEVLTPCGVLISFQTGLSDLLVKGGTWIGDSAVPPSLLGTFEYRFLEAEHWILIVIQRSVAYGMLEDGAGMCENGEADDKG